MSGSTKAKMAQEELFLQEEAAPPSRRLVRFSGVLQGEDPSPQPRRTDGSSALASR